MVAADGSGMEERVALLEHNVHMLAKAMEQARTWLILVGSYNHERYIELHDLSAKAIEGIQEIKRLIGDE